MADRIIRTHASKFQDLTGQTFDRLTVISKGRESKNGPYWVCLCQCGNTKEILFSNLARRLTKSCGCYRNERIREAHANLRVFHPREAKVYDNMKRRCYNPKSPRYKSYGGRGIIVCERWLHSFDNFFTDMGPKPSPEHQIDRIDNDGPYSPENCRWATGIEQMRNRQICRKITWNGETHCVSEWAAIKGISADVLLERLNRGWSFEKASTYPLRYRKKGQKTTYVDIASSVNTLGK